MRHRRKAKYFGVKTAHRKAMFRNMVTSLFRHGRITTTVTRAKELRRLADKLITLAKDGSLHARRQALSVIMDKAVVAKLFTDIADQMASRNGGYTRIVKTGPRRGDGAMMCIIELVRESLKTRKAKGAKPAAEEAAPSVIPEAKEPVPEEPEQAAAVTEESAAVAEETVDTSPQGEEASAEEPEATSGETSQEASTVSEDESPAEGSVEEPAQGQVSAETEEEKAEPGSSTEEKTDSLEETSPEEKSEASPGGSEPEKKD